MSGPRVIDGRAMQPPEPLELTLAALDTLPDGDELVLRVNCEPHPLYQILRRNGYVWCAAAHDDGSHEVRIRKASLKS